MSISSRLSISAFPEEKGETVLDGHLYKRGKFNAEYKNRWFVLYSNNTLSYYQDLTATYEAPLGEISLYSVKDIKEEGNNVFHLVTSKRTFILRCDVKDELDQWLKKIKLRVSPNIICKSWLYKKGEKVKNWKLRYFLLCEYEMHYEVRYYEDEKCKKYKGKINCDYIDDVKILPNTSIQKYGKDKVLELITENRTYVVAGKDAKSRNLWYKSFKKVLFGEDIDKEKEKEKYKQQKIQEEINNAKLFDSLSFSTQQSMKKDNDDNNIKKEPKKELIIKQRSIFVEKKQAIKPISNPISNPISKPISNTEPEPMTESNPFHIKSFEPYIEKTADNKKPVTMNKMIDKTAMNNIDDEKETINNNINTSLPISGSNGHNELNESNPFYVVEHNESMQTENRMNLVNSLDTNNSSISGSNGHPSTATIPDPLSTMNTSITNSNMTDCTAESKISNESGSNGHIQDQDKSVTNTGSVVFSKKFLEAEYQKPTYQKLLDNDIEIVHVSDTKTNKCCQKCVIL